MKDKRFHGEPANRFDIYRVGGFQAMKRTKYGIIPIIVVNQQIQHLEKDEDDMLNICEIKQRPAAPIDINNPAHPPSDYGRSKKPERG